MIYLACPYEGQNTEEVMRIVNQVAGRFLRAGLATYSPLSIGHYAGKEEPRVYQLYGAHWRGIEEEVLKSGAVTLLCIICLDGWTKSKGIKAEITTALEEYIPIIYLKEFQDEE